MIKRRTRRVFSFLTRKWKGETVLSLAFYNKNNDKETYYIQIPLEELDYDDMYQIANDNLKNDAKIREEIMNIELAHFSMESFEEFSERIEIGNSSEISDENKGSAEDE